MESLSKIRSVSNSTAVLILSLVCYVSAAATVLIMEQRVGEIVSAMLIVFVCVLAFMTVAFAASRLLGRIDVVDAAWGPAFVVAMAAALIVSPHQFEVGVNVQTVVGLLVVIWAIRLGVSIARRLSRRPEDRRYVELRKKWKGDIRSNTYIRIFMVQAILVTIISIATIHVMLSESTSLNLLAYVGIAIWLLGFIFEAVGDWQLARHQSNPKSRGTLLTSGLWKYTRHPNYFGEAVMWSGIGTITLTTAYGWVGLVTPGIVTYLLLFVSGVPLAEKALEGRSGWKTYKRRTSFFLPMSPRM